MRIKRNKDITIGLIMLFVCVFGISISFAEIATTKHNLSVSGPGSVRATSEQRICVFCHTPHHAITEIDGIGVPLWNHTLSMASYELYNSPTLKSPTSPEIQPDGSSRLCLSCHDGTVAIGSVINTGTSSLGSVTNSETFGNSIEMQGTGPGGVMPSGPGNLGTDLSGPGIHGTDLSGSHPISIELNDALVHAKALQCADGLISSRVCKPQAGSPAQLERTNNRFGDDISGMGVQCGSCHDPHEDPRPGITVFLRAGDRDSHDQLCRSCHTATCADACP